MISLSIINDSPFILYINVNYINDLCKETLLNIKTIATSHTRRKNIYIQELNHVGQQGKI